MRHILIYGANGYSGRLAALHASTLGLKVIVAGRNAEGVHAIAKETGFEARVFGLDDPAAVDVAFKDVRVVLNCAGPFSRTAVPMVEACIRNRAHYLDITGELDVIEKMSTYSAQALEAGITIMPATGFDVVPTDCMAKFLSELLPDATHLELAFRSTGGLSHGTATTMVENLGGTSATRVNGVITPEPVAQRIIQVPFGSRQTTCMSIPWGDVASAYHTTAIPNIVTYTAVSAGMARVMKVAGKFTGIGSQPMIQKLLKKLVTRTVTGPTQDERANGRSMVWGRVRNAAGDTRSGLLTTVDGYTLTYLASVDIAARAKRGELPKGFQTPAGVLGAQYILNFPNSTLEQLP